MKKNKKLALSVIIIFVAAALCGGLYMLLTQKEAEPFSASFVYKTGREIPSYIFYEPEYNADISLDPEYAEEISYLYYTENGLTRCITDESYAASGRFAEFFGEYFNLLKRGETETFNALHTARYFVFNRECTDIAPQRVYDIHVEYLFASKVSDPDYGQIEKHVLRVAYKIMKNDGTFRSDVGSDASRAQYLELIERNGRLYIDACGDAYNAPGEADTSSD